MADSTTIVDTISSTQAQKEVTANAALNSVSPAMYGARRANTTSGLTWGYIGGRWKSTSIPNGTLTLTGSTTNYIVLNRATGAITGSTTTTNWNDEATYARLYSVVTSSTTVSSYQDHRQPYDTLRRIPVAVPTLAGSPGRYTLVEADLAEIIEISSASACEVELPNELPQGWYCTVVQKGTGQVTFVTESGATRYNRQSHTKTAGQYAVCQVYVTANSGSPAGLTAEWILSGDTAA